MTRSREDRGFGFKRGGILRVLLGSDITEVEAALLSLGVDTTGVSFDAAKLKNALENLENAVEVTLRKLSSEVQGLESTLIGLFSIADNMAILLGKGRFRIPDEALAWLNSGFFQGPNVIRRELLEPILFTLNNLTRQIDAILKDFVEVRAIGKTEDPIPQFEFPQPPTTPPIFDIPLPEFDPEPTPGGDEPFLPPPEETPGGDIPED